MTLRELDMLQIIVGAMIENAPTECVFKIARAQALLAEKGENVTLAEINQATDEIVADWSKLRKEYIKESVTASLEDLSDERPFDDKEEPTTPPATAEN